MATELTEFPAEASNRTGYSRYNWDEFFDGKPRLLAPGEDFTVDIKSFRSAAGQAAKVRTERGDLRGSLRMAVIKKKVAVPSEEEGGESQEVERQFVAMQFNHAAPVEAPAVEEEKAPAEGEASADTPAIPAQMTAETAPETTKARRTVKK